MSTVDTFAAIAPELADDSRVSTFLTIAASQLSSAAFGDQYTLACCYLAAHMLSQAPTNGANLAGQVTAKSAGDLSESYGQVLPSNVTVADAALLTTRFGREFLRIRSTRYSAAAGLVSIYGT